MTAMDSGDNIALLANDPAQIELILSQIESLPVLPLIAAQLVELDIGNGSAVREIIQLIESDHGLSSRILSAVRRSNAGMTADTIERAVDTLGVGAVRNLALAFQILDLLVGFPGGMSSGFDIYGFWRHNLAVGCAARLLAELRPGTSTADHRPAPVPEDAFLCGLLHDVGKAALDRCFPKSYDRVVVKTEAEHGNIADVEREVFGIDHALAGRKLAMHWKLSGMIGECIWLHHHVPATTPRCIAYPQHVHLIELADRIVRHMAIGYSGNYAVDEPLSNVADAAGFSFQLIEKVMSMLPYVVESRAEMMGLNQLTSQEIHHEALARTNVELMRINASLTQNNRALHQRSRCLESLQALNKSMPDNATHEDVCRAALEAVELMLSDREVAVFGCSLGRSIVVVVSSGQGEEPARRKILPASSVGDLGQLSDRSGAWLRMSCLPSAMRDHLNTLFSNPPSWCWPILHERRFLGAIVLVGDMPSEADELLVALSNMLGIWLNAAESRWLAQRLTDEFTEINRRLLASQDEIAQMRSLAMVGHLAGGAAHELNNPLSVISGRAQMLDGEGMDEDVRRLAKVIAEHAHRASTIVSELMDFAKPSEPKPTEWSLAELLGEVRQGWLAKNILREEQFRLQISDGVDKVWADAIQIRMLFDEVVRNAVEAMENVTSKLLIVNCQVNLADGKIMVRIKDNGCGMSPEVLDRAMTPFFSYRPAGRGRGLGLSRAWRYAEINGGKIRLTSKLNEGTVVLVELPAVVGD
ncbi:MAG: HDOD domain-containing protein [Planctomycetota bacterium]|nr:MAG: HDOD domain-containing protein [Planctomycetota bacterium]